MYKETFLCETKKSLWNLRLSMEIKNDLIKWNNVRCTMTIIMNNICICTYNLTLFRQMSVHKNDKNFFFSLFIVHRCIKWLKNEFTPVYFYYDSANFVVKYPYTCCLIYLSTSNDRHFAPARRPTMTFTPFDIFTHFSWTFMKWNYVGRSTNKHN